VAENAAMKAPMPFSKAYWQLIPASEPHKTAGDERSRKKKNDETERARRASEDPAITAGISPHRGPPYHGFGGTDSRESGGRKCYQAHGGRLAGRVLYRGSSRQQRADTGPGCRAKANSKFGRSLSPAPQCWERKRGQATRMVQVREGRRTAGVVTEQGDGKRGGLAG
jgi:hypothetical protein